VRIFEHTSKDRDLWRGWLKNGQAVEISRNRYGWDFGGGIHIHGNDDDLGDRMLFLKFWRFTIILPFGITAHPWPSMEGPQWSVYASKEFGLTFHWGLKRKSFYWPWDLHTLKYQQQMPDGSWVKVQYENAPYVEHHGYDYVLKSGKVQERIATVSKRRHVLCRRAFKSLGWPTWIEESIDVQFSDEVGERSGSWKGGTIGCSNELSAGETMLDSLRRMERERTF
jgi:hypothetical protein